MSRLFTRTAVVLASLGATLVGVGGAQPAALAVEGPFGHQATATVFYPNPVQQLGIQTLTDDKDADAPVFAPAYRPVVLTDLDASGTLTGRYVRVKSKTGRPARSDGRPSRPTTATPTSSSRSWATTG